MTRLIFASLALLGFIMLSSCHPNAARHGQLTALLDGEGVDGAIVVRRLSDGAQWTGGGDRVDQRFLPASSFKIANALIILENGVVTDPYDRGLEWDGTVRGGGWDEDQSLRTGMRRSTVWAFQHWAREVGHDAMARAVTSFSYGNLDIGSPEDIDRFWLDGPLEISAREQVNFLERLYHRHLPVRRQTQDQVIEILEHHTGPGWVLRAKTGWAIRSEPNIGWYVGWLETEHDTWVFAVNIDLDWQTGDGRDRERLARAALMTVGAPHLGEFD